MRTVTAAARRPSLLVRATRWARRHPVLVRGLVVLVGVVAAWACEYATSGAWLALCKLRGMAQAKLATILDQLLRAPAG